MQKSNALSLYFYLKHRLTITMIVCKKLVMKTQLENNPKNSKTVNSEENVPVTPQASRTSGSWCSSPGYHRSNALVQEETGQLLPIPANNKHQQWILYIYSGYCHQHTSTVDIIISISLQWILSSAYLYSGYCHKHLYPTSTVDIVISVSYTHLTLPTICSV